VSRNSVSDPSGALNVNVPSEYSGVGDPVEQGIIVSVLSLPKMVPGPYPGRQGAHHPGSGIE
jgi:hypothetical protein